MRILILENENPEDDEAEFRDGIVSGLLGEFSTDEIRKALSNVFIAIVPDRAGAALAELLDHYLTNDGPFDLVILDPLWGFIGADATQNADVAEFIRNLLTPVIMKHNVGLLIIHHTNKASKSSKDDFSGTASSYDYAGGAELINAARCSMQLRSVGSMATFELKACKRGGRLGWRNEEGKPVYHQYISHDGRPGVISWRSATEEEILEVTASSKAGRKSKVDLYELLYCVSKYPGMNQSWYCRYAGPKMGCTSTPLQTAVLALRCEGLIEEKKSGQSKTYTVSEKGTEKLECYLPRLDWEHLPTEVK